MLDVVGSSGSGSSDSAKVSTPGWPEAGPLPHALSATEQSTTTSSANDNDARLETRSCIPHPSACLPGGNGCQTPAPDARTGGRHFLQIPGPTNVPDRVLRALSAPTIDHRGPEFAALAADLLERLPRIFRTRGPVVVYPSSGTGAWEAALVNTLSPGDRVLAFETGHFATLWRDLAERLGLAVEFVAGDWRHGADPDVVRERLAARPRGRRRDPRRLRRPQRDLDRRLQPRRRGPRRDGRRAATTRCCSSTRSPRWARSTSATTTGAST